MYIKEVSSVGLEPHKSGKLVFSGYNLSLNVVLGGSTTQIGNFVKAIKFVSGITESKELQEEGITSVEAEIVFDNSDTSGRSARNRRSRLVTVKRQHPVITIPMLPNFGGVTYENPDLEQLLGVMECKVAFEDLVMNFILDQEERVKQLEEYMGVIGSDFMQLSLKGVEKLKDEIRAEENRVKKIEKITRYPENEDSKPSSNHKLLETLAKSTSFHGPDFISPKSLCVKYVFTIFPSPPLVRESTFGFKPEEDVFSWLDKVWLVNGVVNGAFGGVKNEEVVVGEGVVVTSSSLEMLTNSCLGRIMVSLIYLEGLEE
uniref:Uncharacterized protein n=1 Tax=Tanacetum cinerariifolium TaxID=118510 RepID=A0A6L2LXN6_TANCI|nr:hypothetical protein [Tanacetum cinerariifolium]